MFREIEIILIWRYSNYDLFNWTNCDLFKYVEIVNHNIFHINSSIYGADFQYLFVEWNVEENVQFGEVSVFPRVVEISMFK